MRKLCRTLTVSIFAAILTAGTLTFADADARSVSYDLNIPSEDLTAALQSFAIASHHKLLYKAELTAGKISRALKGHFTAQEAMEALLSGTGLSYEITGSSVVLIKDQSGGKTSESRDDGTPSSPSVAHQSSSGNLIINPIMLAQVDQGKTTSDLPADKSDEQAKGKKTEGLEEIVVTGTLIHDAAPITPVTTITRDDMINQGYTRLEDVIAQLPQNFKGGASADSNGLNSLGSSTANSNYGFATGINLRGIGGNATLVLLNGRRLAPTAMGTFTDISQIPVSAIDRVEILTDGASSLYGSDAIAGVVNIITRHDFTGAEVGGRVTDISKGVTPSYGGNLLGGYSWGSGNLTLDFDDEKDNPLFARNRPFVGPFPDPYMLTPKRETANYYGSLSNDFSDRLHFEADTLIARGRYSTENLFSLAPDLQSGNNDQTSASAELDYKITSDWTATVQGTASQEADGYQTIYGRFDNSDFAQFKYQFFSFEPRIDGKLLDLPGGAMRLALGGQFHKETYDQTETYGPREGPLTVAAPINSSRRVSSAYGELLIPIVGDGNSLPFVRKLRIDISGRYDHYNDFGTTTNPKVALEWSPLRGVSAHASYARSFQAPTLYDLSTAFELAYAYGLTDPMSPTGTTNSLILDGTNPNLQPETAKTLNAGIQWTSELLPGAKVDLSYFSIDFDNQITDLLNQNYFLVALEDESQLGSFVQRNPTVAQVNRILASRQVINYLPGAINPASIGAIVNLGYVNASTTQVRGLDLTASYIGPELALGRLRTDFDGTYYTRYEESVTTGSVPFSLLNTPYQPLKFRAKTSVGWERSGLFVNGRLNYATGYMNPMCMPSSCPVASWTTVDLSVSYATQTSGNAWLDGIRVGITASNLLDRRPPLLVAGPLLSPFYEYDPINANASLRAIGITFTKRWGADHRR